MKIAHDLIVNQFVDRYKQVKYSGIEHFGSPKARVTASVIERRPLYTDQLYGTHMAILFEELFSSRSIQGDRYIQGRYILD